MNLKHATLGEALRLVWCGCLGDSVSDTKTTNTLALTQPDFLNDSFGLVDEHVFVSRGKVENVLCSAICLDLNVNLVALKRLPGSAFICANVSLDFVVSLVLFSL